MSSTPSSASKGKRANSLPIKFANLIVETVQVPASIVKQRTRQADIIQWMLQYEPSDFAFDPVFRRFALKASNSI